jgi:hypothetical protein
MENVKEVLMMAIAFIGIYGALQLFVRRKERIMLIEKGVNPPDSKIDFPAITKGPSFSGLKFGMFFIGIGIGILMGSILAATTVIDPEVAYFSMIFLFGGLALVIHHFVEKKQK